MRIECATLNTCAGAGSIVIVIDALCASHGTLRPAEIRFARYWCPTSTSSGL